MAAAKPTLDPGQYGADNPPKATVAQAHRYPQDSDANVEVGAVYEGRVNNISDTGVVFVALDEPYEASDLSGIIPQKNQLRNTFRKGEEVYVLVTRTTNKGPVFCEVEVVGTDDRSSFAAEADGSTDEVGGEDEDEDESPTTATDIIEATSGDGEETDTDTESESESESEVVVAAFGCPLCPDDDRFTDASTESVREHITTTDDFRHRDRNGSDPSISTLALDGDGRVVEGEGAAEATPEENGDVRVELVSEESYESPVDKSIIEAGIQNPTASMEEIGRIVSDKLDDGRRISRHHIKWLLAGTPYRGHKYSNTDGIDPTPEAARENIAKLYYYYGLAQREIADRYDGMTQSDVSELTESLGIKPDGRSRAARQAVITRLTDEFDYEWADGLDSGDAPAEAGDPENDPDIVPPTTGSDNEDEDGDEDEQVEQPTETPDEKTAPAADGDTSELGDDTTTRTVGNARYTGPSKGIDLTGQVFSERTAPVSGDESGEFVLPDVVADLPDEAFPDEHPWESVGSTHFAGTDGLRHVTGLVVSYADEHGELPTKRDIAEMDACEHSKSWLSKQLPALVDAGVLNSTRQQPGGAKTYTLADDLVGDTDDEQDEGVETVGLDIDSEAVVDAVDEGLDILEDSLVDPDDVERAESMADRLLADSAASSDMAHYAKGMKAALDMLDVGTDGD